ncbi:GNAT family N-acetyltransferase [Microbacterium sp. NPDC058389]|uniref:GNAT family N-acetyltransferase n=1 Tax=Microbacterium sp. NPDC058389 TaxID=3346475 RepID=UPI003663ED42
MEIEDVWPLFALRLETPRLMLRPIRDEDLPGLVEAALRGVHEPERMPFGVPWTDWEPARLTRSMAQFHWSLRANATLENWGVSFTVVHEGVPVGIQEMHARNFAGRRTIDTASWLTADLHGRGLGKEMRAALLLFGFDHLGAQWAESSAASWNEASLGVSQSLGYERNGLSRAEPRPGEPVDEIRVRVSAEQFRRPEWSLAVTGAERAREHLLGPA